MTHLPDPELYGQKRARRRILILGVILFGLFYGALLLPSLMDEKGNDRQIPTD